VPVYSEENTTAVGTTELQIHKVYMFLWNGQIVIVTV